jgi:SAM-dependent methyltransferase
MTGPAYARSAHVNIVAIGQRLSDHEHWKRDGSAPELYERFLVPAITSIWARDLIARAKLRPAERVLNVACGTGAVTRLAAGQIAGGHVIGLDYNDVVYFLFVLAELRADRFHIATRVRHLLTLSDLPVLERVLSSTRAVIERA